MAIVGLENYYLQYDVMVGAYNDIGDGPNSTTVVIYSAEGRTLIFYIRIVTVTLKIYLIYSLAIGQIFNSC